MVRAEAKDRQMTKTDRALIAQHAAERGAERIRITRSGEAHAYGPMPNASHVVGWWLLAQDADALLADLRNAR